MAAAAQVDKILFITLSNLGDAIMSLPAFDFLRRSYPEARLTVMAAPRTKCVFESHPDVDHLIVFDKHASLRYKIAMYYMLKKKGFDLIVDLKNTFYRAILRAPLKNPAFIKYPSWVSHASQKHLYAAMSVVRGKDIDKEDFMAFYEKRNPSFVPDSDKTYMEKLLKSRGIVRGDKIALIVPGSRSAHKQWDADGFVEVARELAARYAMKIVLAGTASESQLTSRIARLSGGNVIDLAGKTNFGQLSALILSAHIVICNDSGVLQIASYMNRPVTAIFGPTDYITYGPWSQESMIVRKSLLCAPCGKASCRNQLKCLKAIKPFDVLLGVEFVLESRHARSDRPQHERIVVVRTDRIGDVLLSTPVLKVLRKHYPMSHIAMMVSPYTKEIVDGNPFIDEVIVLDKDGAQQGFLATVKFVAKLKKKKFDLAIILHPTLRTHMICFLADIKERIGYDRKAPYFLTKIVPHHKQEGLKHEMEYNFDLLEPLGITERASELYMPIKESSEEFVEGLLCRCGINSSKDKIIAINPAASCVSKRWPVSRFAELADRLCALYNAKIIIVADQAHSQISKDLLQMTRCKPFDLSGQLSLSQLASLFKRCVLVISNDSGPVHLAVAVGTPVISIFGRNQPGLGPKRWGPLGKFSLVLHKKTDCLACLAHACVNNFKCLEAIAVDEVLEQARHLLNEADKNYKDVAFFGKTQIK